MTHILVTTEQTSLKLRLSGAAGVRGEETKVKMKRFKMLPLEPENDTFILKTAILDMVVQQLIKIDTGG